MSIFRFIKQIDEEKPLELYGDGSQSRDFTYVDDIARGTVLAAQLGRRGTVGERREDLSNECSEDLSGLADSFGSDDSNVGYNIINLGGGRKPISLLSVIAYIEKALGKKATINAKPFHAADLQESWADINKARTLLGWHPRVCTDEGFKRAVEWYCRGSEWLKKVTL
jgi:nucleoside-diphosphate-sugar epimerase